MREFKIKMILVVDDENESIIDDLLSISHHIEYFFDLDNCIGIKEAYNVVVEPDGNEVTISMIVVVDDTDEETVEDLLDLENHVDYLIDFDSWDGIMDIYGVEVEELK